ncbi:carbohydrate-binding protein [Pseudomonas koreensis]|uniref:carbohydrate-binding module family 20 domain-containing protein n=1 Tax=Pseudomonas koreensis TaxID=198620 RepID=UPI0021CA8B76|nr:carbohydrate-binding module family 20 domain-containing protein [Pseudomonas koreensis]MCU0071349.1 carbohydrate-binding protein [Pseudomonas koreensis]
MFRIRHLLPQGVLLLAMLSLLSAAQSATFPYTLYVAFQCDNGLTTQGYSVYVVGAQPELGSWDPAKAVKLAPTSYPSWTGTITFTSAKPGDDVAWKCIVRNETDPTYVQMWQPGSDNHVVLAFSKTPPKSIGSF